MIFISINRPKNFKGQIWTFDFLIGLTALSFILLIYLFLWNTITIRWTLANKYDLMEKSAFFASESLLTTSGQPESWETLSNLSNVSAIGLVNSRNELNNIKLDRLVLENSTSYSVIKARLGLQKYELGMRISDLNGNLVYYNFGKFSSAALNNSLSFDRLALLNQTPVIVHLEVWGG